jgi:predicted HTH transcriptional regulator
MNDFISKRENQSTEFKKSVGEWKEIVETVSAFSNASGGEILVGMSNSGKVTFLLNTEISEIYRKFIGNLFLIFKKGDAFIYSEIRGQRTYKKSGRKKLGRREFFTVMASSNERPVN